jgi:hypothetical protein
MSTKSSGIGGIKALVVCHTIGGACAVGPVVRQLNNTGIQVQVLAYDLSAVGFQQQGLPFSSPANSGKSDRLSDAAKATLKASCPRVVLTGTSAGNTLEKALLREAMESGIPTVSVLDNWENYGLRFDGPSGPFHYLPDCLAVMDDISKGDLEDLGCPSDRLAVTGQPYFDDLRSWLDSHDRSSLRRALGIRRGERLLVFASEPQAQDYGDSLGYTEIDSLRVLMEVLSGLDCGRWRLLVRAHPTENPDALSREMAGKPIAAEFAPDWPPRKLMLAADVVVGMTSMFLVEAALLGRATLSLQPGLRIEDAFIGRRLGLVTSAYSADGCRTALEKITSHTRQGPQLARLRKDFWLDGQAAKRVADLVISFLSTDKATNR